MLQPTEADEAMAVKQEQLAAHHTIHRVMTTKADPTATPAENVLNRAFEAECPNEKWAVDVRP